MKIFRLNENDWYLANSMDDAIACAMKETGCERFDVYDLEYAHELTEEELDKNTFCDRGPEEDVMTFGNWRCECGAIADGNCRWNGAAYEHPHPYPMGHVLMKDTTVRTFREELAARLAAGITAPEIFACAEI